MSATKTKTLTAVIDGAGDCLTSAYGSIAGMRVGTRRPGHSLTGAMDARIIAEGYRRMAEWVKRGPLDYVATIEAHPLRCETCVTGCECEAGTPGCGHAHCWGVVSDELYNSCSGVAAVRLELSGRAA